jgi:hypothetical protein
MTDTWRWPRFRSAFSQLNSWGIFNLTPSAWAVNPLAVKIRRPRQAVRKTLSPKVSIYGFEEEPRLPAGGYSIALWVTRPSAG